jgi:DNA-binding transcriptional ArsR family regulator
LASGQADAGGKTPTSRRNTAAATANTASGKPYGRTTAHANVPASEHSVGALQVALGLSDGNTSQHLVALRRVGVVEWRRQGTTIYYRVENTQVFDLLAAGRDVVKAHIAAQQSLLRELSTSS